MNCNLSLQEIFSSIDNELSEEKKFKLFKHLKNCTQCDEEYKNYLKLKSTLASMRKLEPSANFEQILKQKINSVPEKKKRFFRLPGLNLNLDFNKLSFAFGCVGLALGVYFAALFMSNNNGDSSTIALNNKAVPVEKIYGNGVVPPTSVPKAKKLSV
jgi:hypothetical protein